MEALGIPRGSYVVKVNNRKVLDGVMDAVELAGDENAGRRLTVLRGLDKYDRLGRAGVGALLGPGRKDESGDFTKGAGLNDQQIHSLLGFLERRVAEPTGQSQVQNLEFNWTVLNSFAGLPLFMNSAAYAAGINELTELAKLCSAAGYGYDRIRIDPSVVRGLEYYTGPVYEVELLIETKDDKGRPVRFGSVGGGGRYDGLVSRFRGEPVPATGFSIGVSRLQAALATLGKLGEKAAPGPVLVTVFDATASPTTSASSRTCATPTSAPSSISATRRHNHRHSNSNMPTSAARPAPSSRAATKKPRAKCRSRT